MFWSRISPELAVQKAHTIVAGRLLKIDRVGEERLVPTDGGETGVVRFSILTVAVEVPILLMRKSETVLRVGVWLDRNDEARFGIGGHHVYLLNEFGRIERAVGEYGFWADSASNMIAVDSELRGHKISTLRHQLASMLLSNDCNNWPLTEFGRRASKAIQIGGWHGTYPLLKRRLSCAEEGPRLNACVVLANNYFMGQRSCSAMAAKLEGFSRLPEGDRKRIVDRGDEDQRFRRVFLKDPVNVARQISALDGREGLVDVFSFLLQHPDVEIAAVARLSLVKMRETGPSWPTRPSLVVR